MKHEFTIEQWMRREDRSRAPRFLFTDFGGMFGMTEIESGMADVANKAKDDGCQLAEVCFSPEDVTGDSDAFREMKDNGWLVESGDRYQLHPEAVRRVHKRHPYL